MWLDEEVSRKRRHKLRKERANENENVFATQEESLPIAVDEIDFDMGLEKNNFAGYDKTGANAERISDAGRSTNHRARNHVH